MKHTNLLLFTCLNLFICLITIIVCTSYNDNHNSYAISEKTTKITNTHNDSIFDVADYIGEEFTPIDINSKNYNEGISILDSNFQISSKLLNTINEEIANYGAPTSFYILSLKDGMTIGYNVDKYFETASSIKAPYSFYIYKEIANGNIDKNKTLTYTKSDYKTGTGIIKNSDIGTEYTIEQLVNYSLQESDNVAHNMLHKEFGVTGYNEMLKNLGTKYLYLTPNNIWSYTSCRSSALIWQEIYKFSYESPEGINFMNILANGKYNYFKEIIPNKLSASKTGFASKDVIETGIVFDKEYPYIAIAIANKGGKIGAYTEVLKLINYINDIMNEYIKYNHNLA